MINILDRRPIMVAVAGPNGAGKSSFYRTFLADSGLRFVNADQLAQQFNLAPYRAAELADAFRRDLVARDESFVFETVFSDPVGDKINFLKEAEDKGFTVVLIFIGLDSPQSSNERVAMRVARGGHDVPEGKIMARYARTMQNLRRSLIAIPNVFVYDNSDLLSPYKLIAKSSDGSLQTFAPIPKWLKPLLPGK